MWLLGINFLWFSSFNNRIIPIHFPIIFLQDFVFYLLTSPLYEVIFIWTLYYGDSISKCLRKTPIWSYVYAVRNLTARFNKLAYSIIDDEFEAYFICNCTVRKWSHTTCAISQCWIEFFFEKNRNVFVSVRLPKDKFLSEILTKNIWNLQEQFTFP